MGYTMKEVAKRAGVSAATVSRVLNKKHYISAETSRRVREIVSQLQYRKNVHARRLATGQSDLFGLVVSEITNPYFPEIIRGFQAAAWDRGFDVLLCNTEYSQERAKFVMRKLIESDARGVAIMTASVDKSVTDELTAEGIGLVFCNLTPATTLVSTVCVNYQRAISQAIEHVVGLGHLRVAILAGPENNRTAVRIRSTLEVGLKERNIKPLAAIHCDWRIDAGSLAVRALLSAPEAPTALFCGSDVIAMGAMNALEEEGLEVPKDVSIIGFDDIPFASLTRPPLTTIRVPREELGRLAFRALDKLMQLKRRKGSEYKLDTEFVVRSSTAPVRQHSLCLKRPQSVSSPKSSQVSGLGT
jgi:LacI family transcriptional regulator